MIKINSIVSSFAQKCLMVGGMLSLMIVFFVASPITHAAADTKYDPCTVFGNCIQGTDAYANQAADNIVFNLVLGFSNFLIFVGIPISVLFIVFGGYKMISANGNDAEYKAGRSTVTNAIFGLVIIIVSVTIVRLISVVITGTTIQGLFEN